MPKLSSDFHLPRMEAYALAANHLKLTAQDESISYEQRTERLYIAGKLEREAMDFKNKFNVEA